MYNYKNNNVIKSDNVILCNSLIGLLSIKSINVRDILFQVPLGTTSLVSDQLLRYILVPIQDLSLSGIRSGYRVQRPADGRTPRGSPPKSDCPGNRASKARTHSSGRSPSVGSTCSPVGRAFRTW